MEQKTQENVKEKKSNKNSDWKWPITAFFTTFILSLLFSFISTNSINNLELIPAIIILLVVILLGIIFDIIAVAVTVADEEHFHAKAAKKAKGAKRSIKLIRNSSKVANFCADVIGDICGVLSGAISAIIAMKINVNLPFDIQILISALVAALTVGGKAIGKNIAQNKSTNIVHFVGTLLSRFSKEK